MLAEEQSMLSLYIRDTSGCNRSPQEDALLLSSARSVSQFVWRLLNPGLCQREQAGPFGQHLRQV